MLSSFGTQIPFSYKYLNICRDNIPLRPNETFTELLSGTRAEYTSFLLDMNFNESCKISCEKKFSKKDIKKFKWFIDRDYFFNFYLDSLPSGYSSTDMYTNETITTFYQGIPIGFVSNDTYFIYNHYIIYVDINKKDDKFQIVGFSIEPVSVEQKTIDICENLVIENGGDYFRDFNNFYAQELIEDDVLFTYDVVFKLSDKTFSSRWDRYIRKGKEYHWLGLIFANIILFLFSFLVIYILSRAIKKNIDIYNSNTIIEDNIIDEFGWKQVCNDVFRKPKNLILFSCFIGTGFELLLIIMVSLIYNVIGFIHPERRGNLLNQMVICFCIMSIFGGYVSTYIYKNNDGKLWLKNALVTSFLFPGISLIILIIVRILFSLESSTVGFKISEIALLVILWICISTPLVLLGSFFAIKRRKIKYPCKINKLPTSIGVKPWYLKLKYITWLTGLIPFSAIFIEFIYLLGYMWRYQVFYLASFLTLSIIFLVILSSEISIIFIYLNLNRGDYNWWWKSFFVSASPTLYILILSVYYFLYLNISRFTAILVYFLIMGLISVITALVCGSCGVIFTFYFLYFIYSKIKVD